MSSFFSASSNLIVDRHLDTDSESDNDIGGDSDDLNNHVNFDAGQNDPTNQDLNDGEHGISIHRTIIIICGYTENINYFFCYTQLNFHILGYISIKYHYMYNYYLYAN